MSLIMENWRGFVAEDFDLSKLDEEYDAFCKAFDKYCLLNEAAQTVAPSAGGMPLELKESKG